MTVKEQVYQFCTTEHTLAEWQAFQKSCPQVRLKTIGSKRSVQICLDGTKEWMDPDVWASNYRASILSRFVQELGRAKRILSQEEFLETVLGTDGKFVEKEKAFKTMTSTLIDNSHDFCRFIANEKYTDVCNLIMEGLFKSLELPSDEEVIKAFVNEVLR